MTGTTGVAAFGTSDGTWHESGAVTQSDSVTIVMFQHYAQHWRRAMGASSRPERVQHSAYRSIVALGTPVVRILINELRAGSFEWIEALREIMGEKGPQILPKDHGNRAAISAAWDAWGQKNSI